jgi:hypothetical protein
LITVVLWIDPVYVFDECEGTVDVVIHRDGYLGNVDDDVGKRMNMFCLKNCVISYYD